MKYTEANLGRIFILRLEDDDEIPKTIEVFASEHDIQAATVLFLGSAKKDSKVVAGPKNGDTLEDIEVNIKKLSGTSEAVGVGSIFINEKGNPRLHLHSAFGRDNGTITGCTRKGIKIWQVGEIVIMELKNTKAKREIDRKTGFEMLNM